MGPLSDFCQEYRDLVGDKRLFDGLGASLAVWGAGGLDGAACRASRHL